MSITLITAPRQINNYMHDGASRNGSKLLKIEKFIASQVMNQMRDAELLP
jgi:hypothetical protein